MNDAPRRREVVVAGHRRDERVVRAALDDPDEKVRASALRALARIGVAGADLSGAFEDPSPVVRRTAAELCADPEAPDPRRLLADPDATVVEATAWAIGERTAGDDEILAALDEVARTHEDAACRESAVAALGALGDPRAVPAIVAALQDRPEVRRRAVIALAPFDGPDVDAALTEATGDRDRQVRDAARALLEG